MNFCLLNNRFTSSFLQKGASLNGITTVISCNAATGRKGNTKNTHRSNRDRHRGWKVQEGDTVHRGYILATQIHKFRWLPGANVIVGRKMTLTANCSGTIRFTKEIFVPREGTPYAETVTTFPRGALMYKTFINIVPKRDVGRFRLVETV